MNDTTKPTLVLWYCAKCGGENKTPKDTAAGNCQHCGAPYALELEYRQFRRSVRESSEDPARRAALAQHEKV